MKVTLPEFERAGVMVVGDVMLGSLLVRSHQPYLTPEAPVPVVKVNTIEERPGGAANVAMNIATLSANARLVGLTGIDDAAARSVNLWPTSTLNATLFLYRHQTITKLRVLSRNQQPDPSGFRRRFRRG